MRFLRTGRERACALVVLVVGASSMVVGTADAAFPGRNGKIAFASTLGGAVDIHTMNPDGSGVVNLTRTPGKINDEPDWSADGSKIVYNGFTSDHEEIFSMNADGSGRRQLTTQQFGDFSPSWSPDGTKIVFFSFRDRETDGTRNLELYVMNADGSSQTRLTNSPGSDISPAWSPDGSRIAFRSSRDGNPEIYVMNADGTIPLRLTDNPAVDSTPQWSPDGTKLAFTSSRDGNPEIYVMNADGTSEARLTDNLAEDVAPAWSPDGTKIAFSSDRDGRQTSGQVTPSDIFVMNADGTAQTNITKSPTVYDDSPIWQALQGTPPASTTTSTSTSLPPTTTTTTPTTTTVPSSRTQLSPPFGSRGAVFTATTSGLDPGKNYALFFADSARLASGPCHQVGIKVSGPTLSGGDGSATLTSRVPVNAARGAGQVCFALKNNRANHSDAATFQVL